MLTAFRSLVFNVLFYLNLIVQMVVFSPFYFTLPRRKAWFVPKNWVRSSLWLQKVIVGTGVEMEGLSNLPSGSFILAPKHQSFWDAFAFIPELSDPVYILKRELRWIPLFGWYITKMRLIPVDRGSGGRALRQAVAATKIEMADGRQLIIYPEGTRRPPGAEPAYKYGIAELYTQLKVPVVPVAHQAGLYWPAPEIPALSGNDQGTRPPGHPGRPDARGFHEAPDRRHREGLRRHPRRNRPDARSPAAAAHRDQAPG